MKNFAYARPESRADAIEAVSAAGARFLAGGTNLVDLMRENIEQPDVVVDVSRLPLGDIVELADGTLRIGATVRNTRAASHPLVHARYPVLSQAILSGASGQIRNMATTAGNIMQRTRCTYFYDAAARCNKRRAGSGCDARDGLNRNHAILGASVHCVATHPSDLCVALTALDALVHVEGPRGARTIPFVDFHRLPGDTPALETELAADELITAVDIPAPAPGSRSAYRKARDRASYAFALVSVAATLEVRAGTVASVRIALGGIAHKPWRASTAEAALLGAAATADAYRRAARAELAAATPLAMNGFKVALAERMIVAVLKDLTAASATAAVSA